MKRKNAKLSWDEKLPEHLSKELRSWLADLEIVSKYTIKRYIFGEKDNELAPPPPRESLELHIFSDGGGDGYGVVVFIRWKDESGAFKMKRIIAPSRVVSPNSNLSVPCRELKPTFTLPV